MVDDAFRDKRVVETGDTDYAHRSMCSKALVALAGAFAFYAGCAEAGNVQFSSTTPAIAEVAPAAGTTSTRQAPIRRGREAVPPGMGRRMAAGEEFAPQPNTLRAMLPPVTV